ncbi:hypothetical protein MASR2M36_13180 [Providencia sp.]
MIDTLFEKTKPQCIGRYIIDVPESFNNQLLDSTYINDFKIESKFIYPPAFNQRIALREKYLREWIPSAKNTPALKEVIQLPNGNGIIFDRNISGQDDLGRILEAHVYINNIAFIITTEILDLSDPKYKERKKSYKNAGFSENQMNNKYTKLSEMKSLISRLNGRLDNEIPTDKGICIPNGFILDDNKKNNQQINFIYDNSELLFSIESDNSIPGSKDTLLNRSLEIKAAMRRQNMETIKKGNLSPNNLPSQEWLMKGQQQVYSTAENKRIPNIPYYDFWFFANEEVATPKQPQVYIAMNNVNKFTSYSDAQMVEIWDRIVGSLRYKPNAF